MKSLPIQAHKEAHELKAWCHTCLLGGSCCGSWWRRTPTSSLLTQHYPDTAYSAKGLKVWIDYWRQICRRGDLGPWSLPATISACLPKSKQVGLSYTPYHDSLSLAHTPPAMMLCLYDPKKNSKGPPWTETTEQNKCPSFYIVSPKLVVMATKND